MNTGFSLCICDLYIRSRIPEDMKGTVESMLLFYIRHGDPIYNPDSLTPLGQRQAEALAKRLSLHGLDEIYVSSSERAAATARPTCEMLKIGPTVLDWTNEKYAWQQLACEDSNGHRSWLFQQSGFAEDLASPQVRALGPEWYDHPCFAAHPEFKEGILRIQSKADEWLEGFGYCHIHDKNMYLNTQHNEKRIALFAHQGFGLAFLSCVLDVPYPVFSTHFDLSHSSMTVIQFSETEGLCVPRAIQVSNDSHIYREGLPTKYDNRYWI